MSANVSFSSALLDDILCEKWSPGGGADASKINKLQKTSPGNKTRFATLKKVALSATYTQLVHDEIMKDFSPPSPKPNIKSKDVIYVIEGSDDIVTYGDLTGKFPYTSTRGHKYVMIAYNYDGNNILAAPLKNREVQTIVAT